MALTEKFESNSVAMKIHISQPCKDLLSPQYKCVERTDEGLIEKVKFVLGTYSQRTWDGPQEMERN